MFQDAGRQEGPTNFFPGILFAGILCRDAAEDGAEAQNLGNLAGPGMDEKDYIEKRGETIFAFLIGKRCDGAFWFLGEFIDGKAETKDFTVYLIEPSCGEATFFVQVKATAQGYRGKGANRKLNVKVAKEDVAKLKRVTGPAYVAGIDIDLEVGFSWQADPR
jgi:hypothetical protein